MMEPLEQTINILVVSDRNFINLCANPKEYWNTFRERVGSMRGDKISIFTVTGHYGIANIDESVPVIDVLDKNKTLFRQMLENSSMMFDEVMAITSVAADPYIESAREVAINTSKTFTRYGYPRK